MCSYDYVELHCHSAYSFLDGASMPDELVPAALELGHDALALTDHNGVSARWSSRRPRTALGLRAIHGAELDLDDGRHVTLLVRERPRLVQPVSPDHARARAHARAPRQGAAASDAPRVSARAVLEHAEGLVCLTGCAARGVHDEPATRALLREAFGRDRLRVELQRPFHRDDRARNRGAGRRWPRRLGVAMRGHRQRPRARALARAAPGRARGRPPPHHARRLRAAAARQLVARARLAGGDGRALRRSIPRRWRRPRGWRSACGSTCSSDLGYRYPGSEDPERHRAAWPSCARHGWTTATPAGAPPRRGAARGWRRSCA